MTERIGRVIVLNGSSSSGKTTLAREFQLKCSSTFLVCSLDAFWDMTPADIPAGSGNFPNMKLALAKTVRALAETGHNVIVDIIFCGQKTYNELTRELAGVNLRIIKVDCHLEQLRKREINRADRRLGLAESQLATVHEGVIYDLEVNTSVNTPEQCALEIINSLH